MSDPAEWLFPPPAGPARGQTLAELRQAVTDAQAAAVAALRRADDVSGEDNGADDLAADFMAARDVQSALLDWLYPWQHRDDCHWIDDEEEWSHPEGPLSQNEREMMVVFQAANDRLNTLITATWALRAREAAELAEAGAVVAALRMPGPKHRLLP